MARLKTDHLWSSRFSAFEKSIHESGGSYPPILSELISKIEISSVLEIVETNPNYRMLDIGAGGGRWTFAFAERVKSITALEPSQLFQLLKQRSRQYENVTCLKQPFETYVASDPFHLVVCSGVLVYIRDQEEADNLLTKATKSLQKGGYLVLREPVARTKKYLIDWVITNDELVFQKRFDKCGYWEIIRPENHYEEVCKNAQAEKISSFPCHAPFFYHLSLPNRLLNERLKEFVSLHITLANFEKIRKYNRLFRTPYGIFRHLLGLRTMRLMIFKKH